MLWTILVVLLVLWLLGLLGGIGGSLITGIEMCGKGGCQVATS